MADPVSVPSASSPAGLPLGEDAVLVHIGPYKTGTTAIQSSLAQHRADLEAHGVWYPGTTWRHMREGWSLLGESQVGAPRVGPEEWDALAAQVRARRGRVCLSTEDFVRLQPDAIRKLAADLGEERVQMVVVARRLDKLIPSAWQQRIKSSHETRTFAEFVREIVAPERTGDAARTFWFNHELDAILDRWLAVMPADRITVIVSDDRDRGVLHRGFERLLGLPDGLLTPGPRENTSLTLERIELYRRLNLIADARGWDAADRRYFLHNHFLEGLTAPERAAVETSVPAVPAWADARLTELADQRVAGLVAAGERGVRLLGDPASLRYVPAEGERDDLPPVPEVVSVEAAARGVERLFAELLTSRDRLRRELREARQAASPAAPALDGVSSKAMLREAARRQLAKARHRLRRR